MIFSALVMGMVKYDTGVSTMGAVQKFSRVVQPSWDFNLALESILLQLQRMLYLYWTQTQTCRHSLQEHTKPIHSVSWDPSGELLASVSEDSVRVWSLGSGSEGECVHELSCNGNKFHSCFSSYISIIAGHWLLPVFGAMEYFGE